MSSRGAVVAWVILFTFSAVCHGAREFEVFPGSVVSPSLSSPNCITYHPAGFWVVSDTGNDRIVLMNEDLTIRSELSEGLSRPRGVAVDLEGRIWICDSGSDRVLVVDEDLNVLQILGGAGNGPGEFDLPWGISSMGDRVAVSDSLNRRVQVFDLNGSWVDTFGSRGTGPGEFDAPLDISFDSRGRILVVDSYLEAEGYVRRVQVFNHDYSFSHVIWDIQNRLRFTRPVGIGLDPGDNVAVADFMANRIYLFDDNGKHLGGIGSVADQPNLVTPYDVAFAELPDGEIMMGIVERDPGRVRTVLFTIPEVSMLAVLSLLTGFVCTSAARMGIHP